MDEYVLQPRAHSHLPLTVRITGDSAEVDFTGTLPHQTSGGINANFAITLAAVAVLFSCRLVREDVLYNSPPWRTVPVIAPRGTIVNAQHPSALAGGSKLETSQRITDVVLGALIALPEVIPAASQGTMNNVTLGGNKPAATGSAFAYYETMAGGMGGRNGLPGLQRRTTHMSDTLLHNNRSDRTLFAL